MQVLARSLPCGPRTLLPLEDFSANDIICLSASLFSLATLAATYRKRLKTHRSVRKLKNSRL